MDNFETIFDRYPNRDWCTDGRFNKQFILFLGMLQIMGVEIFFFNTAEADSLTRDEAMAENILKNKTDKKTLCIAGNYHFNNHNSDSASNYLAKNNTESLLLQTFYNSGEYFNAGETKKIDVIEYPTGIQNHPHNNDLYFVQPTTTSVF